LPRPRTLCAETVFRIFRPFHICSKGEKKRNQMILLSACACRESCVLVYAGASLPLNCSLGVCYTHTHTEHCICERSRLTKSVHEHRGSTPPTSTPNHAQSCPHSHPLDVSNKSTWSYYFCFFLFFLSSGFSPLPSHHPLPMR